MEVEHAKQGGPSFIARQGKRPAEVTEAHTRILRLALGIEESRAYWEHVDPAVTVSARALVAFEQRWFGGKSSERVRFLIANLSDRYDPFPDALAALRRWRSMDAATRQVICHWHLQLADPLYRRFTGELLVRRRGESSATLDRNVVLRWVQSEYPERWAPATCMQFASKLLSAASEAGLVSPKRDPRTLPLPKVPDAALTYLLYVLKGTDFAGSLTDNPYLASVGLTEGFVDQRLRALSGLTFRRMGNLVELDWPHANVAAWAEASL